MLNDKTILAIIPARGGSKGIPRKNVKLLGGLPLIAHSIASAKKSGYIDRVMVSTEDEEIAEVSKEHGADVPFLRPAELATDSSPTIDSIIHTIKWLENNEGFKPDYICVLQCTSPFRTEKDIDGAIEKLIDMDMDMDGIVSVCEAEVNPYWSNIFKGDKLEYFMPEGKNMLRRQDLPKVYRYNGAIYLVKTSIVLNEKTLEPTKLAGYVMSNDNSVDIDEPIDFKFAEAILNERREV